MRLGKIEISFLHTPGHTPGSQCLKVGERLVTGDTLFIGGCGRVDLPNSDPQEMAQSLRRLSGLPAETVIWPGHNYAADPSATLGRELRNNPYLKLAAKSLEDFLRLVGG
jgi:glyoxylase-like metal-dependent hydrolase (beta-lactamase superfamily II)